MITAWITWRNDARLLTWAERNNFAVYVGSALLAGVEFTVEAVVLFRVLS